MKGGRVRIGIIGAGFWGRNHARVLSELEGASLEAVCDIDVERAREVAAKYRAARYYKDYMDVLKREDIDAVTVCTPSTTHASICLDALRSGKDVLVEKPMATNLAECVSIVDACRSSGRRLMVGFIERFNSAVRIAKEQLLQERIGRPLLIYGRRIGPWPERIGDVGVVKDTSIHDIDLAIHLFDEKPLVAYASGGSIRHNLEDYVHALISFRGERNAILEANWLTPRKKRELKITGTDGVIHIEFLSSEVVIEKSEGVYIPSNSPAEPLKAELQFFASSLQSGATLSPNEIDGTWAMAVAEGVLLSMRKKQPVYINDLLKEHGLHGWI